MTIIHNIINQLASGKKQWIIATVVLGGLSLPTTMAQSPWNVSIGVQASSTELRSDESLIENDQSLRGGLNLGVGYALNERWSLHSGVGIGYLKNNTGLLNFSGKQNTVDIEGDAFEFRYTLTGYSENQRYTVVSIPLAVQYETAGATRFYARAGANYNIFVTSEAKAKANSLITTGFFEHLNAELEGPKFAGFGTFEDNTFAKEDIDIKNAINAILELGIKQSVAPNHWLYLGIFVETGLNNLLKSNGEGLLQYNRENPTDFQVNPSLNATDLSSGNAFLKDAKFRSFGLKFWYSFNF